MDILGLLPPEPIGQLMGMLYDAVPMDDTSKLPGKAPTVKDLSGTLVFSI
jgi:hypothetical protein